MKTRLDVTTLGLTTGKKGRLHRILYQSGLRNGTALLLPYGHGLAPGSGGLPSGAAAVDPADIIRLAFEGDVNAIVLPVDVAEEFYWDYAGELPLIMTLNGKMGVRSGTEASAPVNATVADAVRLGADAVGYSLYLDSPVQESDFSQYRQVQQDADRCGMPLFVWAYPCGTTIEAKGGKDSLYAVDYAARAASELGADVVTVSFPHPERQIRLPRPRDARLFSQMAIDDVVRSAHRSLVLVSSGRRASLDAVLDEARQSMEAGAVGLVFDVNLWPRGHAEPARLIDQIKEILGAYCS